MWWDKPGKVVHKHDEQDPIPFMKMRWIGFLISAVIIIGTTVSLATQGLSMGLDFTGGVQVSVAQPTPFDTELVRKQISDIGIKEPIVNRADGGTTAIIRFQAEDDTDLDALATRIHDALGPQTTIRERVQIGGKVSGELFQGGVIASIMALVCIAVYIWFRFERKFGMAALITTFHDVYAIIGLFSIFKAFLPFDLTIVAGVLTLAGYSINDKVVVFDRIREMLKKYKKIPLPKIIDISITATLSRTLITSLATLMAGGAMLFLGGPVLFGFAVSVCFGIVIGTYSSIFVAAPLLIHLPGRVPGQRWAGEGGTDAGREAPVRA
jgi:preprotein translocase subunit SecF